MMWRICNHDALTSASYHTYAFGPLKFEFDVL